MCPVLLAAQVLLSSNILVNMAHFAKIENGVVVQVIVVSDSDTSDIDGVEKEYIGANFCERLFGGDWKQTSYNGRIRKNYAGIGFAYDEACDAFIPPKPFPSWVLEEENCQWVSAVAYPKDGKLYSWDEDTLNWMQITGT